MGCVFGAILLTALPKVDAPDTAFNETDTPVLVSLPVLLRVRSITPFVLGIDLSEAPALPLADSNYQARKFTSARRPGYSNLQPLLCTFLI